VRKLRTLVAVTLATAGIGGTIAATALATQAQNVQAGWRDVTYNCLQYQGCHNITEYYRLADNNCTLQYFYYDTAYVGRKYRQYYNCS
jgi:hypothetical protein